MLPSLIVMALLSLASSAPAEEAFVDVAELVVVREEQARDEQAQARADEALEREEEARDRAREAEERLDESYENAQENLDEGHWDQAIRLFDDVARQKGRRADAALYWKAYAQQKRGQRAEALAALGELRQAFPSSRWLADAKALEVEIKQGTRQAVRPEGEPDEELKLIALNSLLSTDAERALPMIEKFLAGNQSPKLRERALFVLCQSGSPRAREIVVRIARGGGTNPELQLKAIKYLGLFGGAESRGALSEIYGAAADVMVKKAILQSFMVSGERGRLLAAAKGESVPELRRDAIHQLGVMGAQDELWEMYRAESSLDMKKAMLQAFFVGGNSDRLMELARTEKDAELRLAAIRNLGMMGGPRTADTLVSLYGSEKDPTIRKQVIEALFIQGNAKALVEIARKETDPALRKTIVTKLSHMGSKDATDFLLEILDK